MIKFELGDRVTWSSQAAGVTRTKEGTVIEVVPPNRSPKLGSRDGMVRNHESYTVRAVAIRNSNRRTKVYWPRVGHLEPLNEEG